jgi:hypothetical protein
MTDEGYTRLRAATPTHLRGVAAYVVDRVTADQLDSLGDACALIAEAPDVPRTLADADEAGGSDAAPATDEV